MILTAFNLLFAEAKEVWVAGGWGMNALAFNALVLYGMGAFVFMKLIAKGLFASPEWAWRRWKRQGGRARGTLGQIIRDAMASRSLEEMEHFFDSVRNDELSPFERDLRVMKVSVTTAPLLGLLGTVTGMLATFNALATGGGGDKTMGMIASGISEALITTEAGLVLALSGLMFQYVLMRQHDRFGTHIEHVATLCMQEWRRTTPAAA
jgi:biopolymer transport protein ExbB